MIYVLGGSGFIGTRLCARLDAVGTAFTVVDKRRSVTFGDRTSIADVRSLDALRAAIPDSHTSPEATLVNLAAEHRDDVRPPSLYYDVNVGGAENACALARERGIERIVFTSSVAVYGFAPPGTDEAGAVQPFNEYGRTKALAEQVYRSWHAEDLNRRTLVIVRPTVVFGEGNRGNVYNLLRQIARGAFVMIGRGDNIKSLAYVENVAAFLEYTTGFSAGLHVFNYIDTPDLAVNELVRAVRAAFGRTRRPVRVPYGLGLAGGYICDVAARLTGRSFPVSAVRVRKFAATTRFSSRATATGFSAPVSLAEALDRTIRFEFIDPPANAELFYTE
ncbi:MAG: NAD(P)-dependent oxidoreductase [Spirochaetaceae bacterium]|nr:MAG: NAD(P)-dependent oxidoreductase [Spirochaetaceae bacterium]